MRKSEEERFMEEIEGKTPTELLRYIAVQHKALKKAKKPNPFFDGMHSVNSIISKQRRPMKKAKIAAEKLYGKESESFKHIMEKLYRETPKILTTKQQIQFGIREQPGTNPEINDGPTRRMFTALARQKNQKEL